MTNRMIPNQVHFRLIERPDKFLRTGKEWALMVQFVGHSPWTLKTWEKRPNDKNVEDAKGIILRSFEMYHKHLTIPKFDVEAHNVE